MGSSLFCFSSFYMAYFRLCKMKQPRKFTKSFRFHSTSQTIKYTSNTHEEEKTRVNASFFAFFFHWHVYVEIRRLSLWGYSQRETIWQTFNGPIFRRCVCVCVFLCRSHFNNRCHRRRRSSSISFGSDVIDDLKNGTSRDRHTNVHSHTRTHKERGRERATWHKNPNNKNNSAHHTVYLELCSPFFFFFCWLFFAVIVKFVQIVART